MCGIAGAVLDPAADPRPVALGAMTDSLRLRGPDADGHWVRDGVYLGHRRLSVIDIAGGVQPMQLPDDGPVIVYNGEVYNYATERAELEHAGHRFATASDTEVVLRLYAVYGLDFVEHLRGMFAIAIWDPGRRRLVLARDRLGIKPLYWARAKAGIVFGSELKAVIASGLVPPDIDPQAVDDFFAHGYVRGPRSIIAGVHKLPPGHLLVVEGRDGLPHELHRYWSIPQRDPERPPPPYEEAKEQLQTTLEEAVRLRLRSDVPLGALLSGGIDSSAVVWMMTHHLDRPVTTFCIGFDDASVDETRHAEVVARHFHTEHHNEVVTADSVGLLPELMAAHDEPFGDPSSIPTWYVSRLARKHVTVCLSGDGGDEVFAGYVRYPHIGRELAKIGRWPRPLLRALSLTGKFFPLESRRRNVVERWSLDLEQHYSRFRSMFSADMRRHLFTAQLADDIDMDLTSRVFAGAGEAARSGESVARLQAADLGWYLPDDVLCKVDRMSMAHSLEVRVPLLDHRFVELAATLPVSYKLRNGNTKAILRDIIEPHLPPSIVARGKQGFSLPLRKWFAGPLRQPLLDAIEGPTYRDSGWFRPSYLRALWARHESGAHDLSWALWQVLVFDVWYRQTRPGLGHTA